MLEILNFVVQSFKVFVGFLIAMFLVWALPTLIALALDLESPAAKTSVSARHRRAPGVSDDWMKQRVEEFRNVQTKAKRRVHRANMMWADLVPYTASFFSSMSIREDRELTAA
jgi:hypothetical protein